MSVRRDSREDTASKPDELQIGSSCIPATPAKATSTSWPPICTNLGENQTMQANWLEKERLATTNHLAEASLSGREEFVQQTQCQREPACHASISVNNASRFANKCQADKTIFPYYCEQDELIFLSWADKCFSLSTYDDLDMNNLDVLKAALDSFATRSSASSSCFHHHLDKFVQRTQCHREPACRASIRYFTKDQPEIAQYPQGCALDSNGSFVLAKEILNETVCSDDTKTLQDLEDGSSNREANSMKPSQNASGDDSSLQGNFRGQSTDTSPAPVISCEIIANRSVSLKADGKDTEDPLSSHNSVDSLIAQTTGKSDSCLLITSEEEPTAGVKPNGFISTSLVKLLQMTDDVLHGVHGEGSDKGKPDERHYIPS